MNLFKKIIFILFLSFFLQAKISDVNCFSELPIINDGRIKPLETFAKNIFMSIHENKYLKYNKSHLLLFDLLFKHDKFCKKKIFKIRNNEILNFLRVKENNSSLYSFQEISNGLRNNFKLIDSFKRKKDDLNLVQKQILELEKKIIYFYDISKNMSFVLRVFHINNSKLFHYLHIGEIDRFSYLDFLLRKQYISKILILERKEKNKNRLFFYDLSKIIKKFRLKSFENSINSINFIYGKEINNSWISIQKIIDKDIHTGNSVSLIEKLSFYSEAYVNKNLYMLDILSNDIGKRLNINSLSKKILNQIKIEIYYNKYQFFKKSAVFYILSFIIIIINFLFVNKIFYKASLLLLSFGFLFHFFGLLARSLIMSRPPVSTLYESIIFVGFIIVFFSLLIEILKKDWIGLFVASFSGIIFYFLSNLYISDSDTMGVLEAILNSNFWLSIHVLSITIGYSCCFLLSVMGHMYLVNRKIIKNISFSKKLMNKIKLFVIISTLFTLTGTTLGGVWADQSWGRFWGWDPKENGALLIILWLTMVIHGKIGGILNELNFCNCLVFLNIIVIFAWFGVNLLNTGLHSYGFTDGIFLFILIIFFVEILFILFFGTNFFKIYSKK
jgi:ABC-type transport system involved in cytochrome c biogenesis permease subunit